MGTRTNRSSVLRAPLALGARALELLGRRTLELVAHMGTVLLLLGSATGLLVRSVCSPRLRLGRAAITSQICRVGVRSIWITSVVSGAVGAILALQLAPPLDEFGQRPMVANITGVAILRELGPLIGAIVLTGFAGASIAAEIGTMKVSEEIEALEAHALNPIRFLVIPRVLATLISMTILAVWADVVAISASLFVSTTLLEIPYATFMDNLLRQVKLVDFLTGIAKGALFGLLIGIISCTNGLKVQGGAAGVGQATTLTVVQCIVSIIIADLIFTALFFSLELF